MEFSLPLLIILVIVLLKSIVQINEYERGIKFSQGKFYKIMEPGWRLVLPIFQSYKKIDIRTKAVDVPEQDAITKDNVSVRINAVIYYKIFDASKALLEVENFYYAVSQLAQTTMRNAVGSVSLDELLAQREKLSQNICEIIDKATDPWGIKVENVELKDVVLPEDMKRVIAKVAEAEREKMAVITKAVGEVEASKNLAEAATTMSTVPGAMHLRTLSTINDVSSDQSNTIIFCLPIEILESFKAGNSGAGKVVDMVKKANNHNPNQKCKHILFHIDLQNYNSSMYFNNGSKYDLSVQSHFCPTAHINAFCQGSYSFGFCFATAFCNILQSVLSVNFIFSSSHAPRQYNNGILLSASLKCNSLTCCIAFSSYGEAPTANTAIFLPVNCPIFFFKNCSPAMPEA